jgi:hypothetical protein
MIDVMKALFIFTILLHGHADDPTDRYSERNQHSFKVTTRLLSKNYVRYSFSYMPALWGRPVSRLLDASFSVETV